MRQSQQKSSLLAGWAVCLLVSASGSIVFAQAFGGSANVMGHVYDAAKDFSITANPNGPWSYGYSSTTKKGGFSLFRATRKAPENIRHLELWAKNSGQQLDDYPWIAHNKASSSIKYYQVVQPPAYLNVRPGNDALSVVRFTAPVQAWYLVQGQFVALDKTTTDPHILHNGEEVQPIPAIRGEGGKRPFEFSISLRVGDTLDFAVDNGGNGANFDSTGLSVTIKPSLMRPIISPPPLTPLPVPTNSVAVPPALAGIKQPYDNQIQTLSADTAQQIKRLQTEYLVVLDKLKGAAMSHGNLDAVLAAQAEIDRITSNKQPGPETPQATDPVLLKNRKQYNENLSRLLAEVSDSQAKVQQQYLTQLEKLERDLTRRGDISGAVAVRKERQAVKAEMAP